MTGYVLATITVIGLATSANADFWFDGARSEYAFGDQPRGDPYIVAGFGDDYLNIRQDRYWGGPYWVACSGVHLPFETYRSAPNTCRRLISKVTIHGQARMRMRLK